MGPRSSCGPKNPRYIAKCPFPILSLLVRAVSLTRMLGVHLYSRDYTLFFNYKYILVYRMMKLIIKSKQIGLTTLLLNI